MKNSLAASHLHRVRTTYSNFHDLARKVIAASFGSFCVEPVSQAGSGRGIAWLLSTTGGGLEFVVATRSGLQRVKTFDELLTALDTVGDPTDFPLADWPGVTVSTVV